jgi:hypothetical protein
MSERWELGNVFILRHAGFPFDWLESLGFSSNVLAHADAVLAAEERLSALALGSNMRAASHVYEAVLQGRTREIRELSIEGWQHAVLVLQDARHNLSVACEEELLHLRKRLHTLASDARVQEAVFLSSPAVYENLWQRYVSVEDYPANAHWRRVERVVYTYLQRFCAKNETTSFFGPTGYGEIVEGTSFQVRTLREQPRRTFLSYWAVSELARAINLEHDLQQVIPLRHNPLFTTSEGMARSIVLGRKLKLKQQAQRFCAIVKSAPNNLSTITQVAQVMKISLAEAGEIAAPLLKIGVLLKGITVPADTFDTLKALYSTVHTLPSGPTRTRWLERIEHLTELLVMFAQADFSTRRSLLRTIEALFSDYTGTAARRGDGQFYADRLVLYEEAASRFRIQMSRTFAEELTKNVSACLNLSAAYGQQVQRDYQLSMMDVLDKMEGHDFLSYAALARPKGQIQSQFAPLPTVHVDALGEHAITLPQDWCGTASLGGRYALPDVCIMADTIDNIQSGNFKVVLSRVHHHLLLWSWISGFYHDRDKFESAARAWLERENSVATIAGLELKRRNKGFYCFPGKRVAMPAANLTPSPDTILSAADLSITAGLHGPELRDPEGKQIWLYLSLADYITYPPFAALTHPPVLHAPLRGTGPHLGRVQVGGAVYQRERWSTIGTKLTGFRSADLLLAVRRMQQRGGWPRFVFARVGHERKPYLIDFESPFSHELLRHLCPEGAQITFEEMLPGPEDLWLQDELGRYTSELRMQAVRWSDLADGTVAKE